MQKLFFVFFYVSCFFSMEARNFYVSPNGNDAMPGDTPQRAIRNPQVAADRAHPGDSIYLMDGNYSNELTESVIRFRNSGEKDKPIVLCNFMGTRPVIYVSNLSGITFESASYIVVEGLEITRHPDMVNRINLSSDPENFSTKGNGILMQRGLQRAGTNHHIKISNNVIHHCLGSGMLIYYSDYITLSYNTIFDNGHYSATTNSGIRFSQSETIDKEPVYHNYIIANEIYNNRKNAKLLGNQDECEQSAYGSGISIRELANHNQNNINNKNASKTLVANNIVYLNGGVGLDIFNADYVDVINNTLYKNNQMDGSKCGELFVKYVSYCNINNNIIYANTARASLRNIAIRDVLMKNNIYYNTSYYEIGQKDIIENPMFVNIAPEKGILDFHIKDNSPAIDAGINELISSTDFEGNNRVKNGKVDIGAYEFTGKIKETHERMRLDNKSMKLFWTSFYVVDKKRYTIYNHQASPFMCQLKDARNKIIKRFYVTAESGGQLEIDLSDLDQGLYIVEAFTKTDKHRSRFIYRFQ